MILGPKIKRERTYLNFSILTPEYSKFELQTPFIEKKWEYTAAACGVDSKINKRKMYKFEILNFNRQKFYSIKCQIFTGSDYLDWILWYDMKTICLP